MKNLLKQLVKYNWWANEKYISMLTEIPARHLDVTVKSSFPSIRKTLFHIWDAEELWKSRLKGRSPDHFPSHKFPLTTPINKMLKTSAEFYELVKDKEPEFFSESCTYKSLNGEEFTQPREALIVHCMNHSGFHRGQIITILRGLGYTAFPQTDFIHFLRTGGQ